MVSPTDISFNKKPSTIMHIDLNSCFATIEQQANPLLRGKPIAVSAYDSPGGCIIAPSVEAKRFGVKVGMRVKEGKMICPNLITMAPDPWKYRFVHIALRKIISDYTSDFSPKSIDEFVLNLEGYPAFKKGIANVAKEIKERIKKEIGEWLTVSVGIGPNRFLAKVGAGLNKPDGLDEINSKNFKDIYGKLVLTDLCGIKVKNAIRLASVGIHSVMDFYEAPYWKLKAAFQSVAGYYWYLRIRGWEIDDVEFGRRSYGNSFALPKPLRTPEELSSILTKLCQKTGFRLRRAGFKASGIHLAISYRDHDFWHCSKKLGTPLHDSRDIYKAAFRLLAVCPHRKEVRDISIAVFDLLKQSDLQLDMFNDLPKKELMIKAQDKINERWGSFIIAPAKMSDAKTLVPDRIAFGGVKELEEFTLDY
jgi:DNA polymerase-4